MKGARKSGENKLNGIHKLLVYVENVNSDENTSTTKVEFLFWKSETFIPHVKNIYQTVL
jgi:hypothetical protein